MIIYTYIYVFIALEIIIMNKVNNLHLSLKNEIKVRRSSYFYLNNCSLASKQIRWILTCIKSIQIRKTHQGQKVKELPSNIGN